MRVNGIWPSCEKNGCFANEDNRCMILINTKFGKRSCPFFKTGEQVEQEKEYCRKRMAELKKNMEE